MKRRERSKAWPRGIVEVASTRPDPRADPSATQKMSRDVLDDALRRTKSGTQRIQREDRFDGPMPEPKPARQPMESLAGPRDSYSDAPIVTVLGIESMELHAFDPQLHAARQGVLARNAAILTPPAVTSDLPPPAERTSQISRIVARLRVSPRTILVALLALVAFMASAGLVGLLR